MSSRIEPRPPLAGDDATAGYRALTESCARVERSWVERWVMSGADRARFLNGLVTCAVTDLAPGSGVYGFVTSPKGKVLADLVVLASEEAFLLELPAGRGEAMRDHLLKYRIADRVELEPAAGDAGPTVGWTVAGPRAAAVLSALTGGAPPAAAWQHRRAAIAGAEVRLVRDGLAPAEAWDLWLAAEAAPAVDAALTAAGAEPVAVAAWEARRVELGLPRFGLDFGDDNLPQETGLDERAVSYDKGCYLGQEVVARIHYRGGVNKGLRGLDLGAAPPPPPGADVLHDGRSAGRLGSAVVSPALGRTVALAVLHQRAGEAGTEVEVAGVGPAVVRELPFVP